MTRNIYIGEEALNAMLCALMSLTPHKQQLLQVPPQLQLAVQLQPPPLQLQLQDQ